MRTAQGLSAGHLPLLTSFITTATLGSLYVWNVWLTRHLPVDAALRCVTLCSVLAAVHLAGFTEFNAQPRRPERIRGNLRRVGSNISFGLIVGGQLVVLSFCSRILDGGDTLPVAVMAFIVCWLCVAVGIGCRTRRMTWFDRNLFRFGFYPLLPIVGIAWGQVLMLRQFSR